MSCQKKWSDKHMKIIKIVVILFWLMDILIVPFMEIFDTTYPLNTLFWSLVFIICGGIEIKIEWEG